MKRLWALALLIIPLVDVVILVFVAGRIGAAATVAIVVLTALIGLGLAQFAGRRALRRIQQTLARGELPTDPVLDGALILVAAAVLLTPGLVTDGLGLLLLFAPTRAPIRILLKRYIITPLLDEQSGGFVTGKVYTAGFPNHSVQSEGPERVDIDVEDVNRDESDREGNA